jgi:penicillin amidase
MVDGAPLYLGALYDPGTRVGRITKRITDGSQGTNKLTLGDMQSIQADAVTEWGQIFYRPFLDGATALAGRDPEVADLVEKAKPTTLAVLAGAIDRVTHWTFDTSSGLGDETSSIEVADAQATAIMAAWTKHFTQRAVGDEVDVLTQGGTDDPGDIAKQKLVARMVREPEKLATPIAPETNDSLLFDDLTTPAIESKRRIAAMAVLDALDELVGALGPDLGTWRWGNLHTLTLDFFVPLEPLRIPEKTDPMFPHGFPRHGDTGTVDVGGYGYGANDYAFGQGPAIRFVCELTPDGPVARNVLPGGETLDPASPHYADQIALWRRNRTFDLAFKTTDVTKSAVRELAKNGVGRTRFMR